MIKRYLLSLAPVMGQRNFRLFFVGQAISMTGTVLQTTILGWQIYVMTGSAEMVGTVAALAFVPPALLIFFGGAIVDGYNKQHVLYLTNSVDMILAGILAYLTITDSIEIWQIMAVVVAYGFTTAIDRPAQKALLLQIIVGQHVTSAMALNSTLIMITGSVGGLFAIVFIRITSELGWAYAINGTTFLVALACMYCMRLESQEDRITMESPMRAIISGCRYLWQQEEVIGTLILWGVVHALGYSYKGIFPVLAKEIFNGGPEIVAALLAALMMGGLIGCIIALVRARNNQHTKGSMLERMIPWMVVLAAAETLLGLMVLVSADGHATVAFVVSIVCLVLAGMAIVNTTAVVEGSIMSRIDPVMRGRVSGFIAFIFCGNMFGGSWIFGTLSESYGSTVAVVAAGLFILSLGYALCETVERDN